MSKYSVLLRRKDNLAEMAGEDKVAIDLDTRQVLNLIVAFSLEAYPIGDS